MRQAGLEAYLGERSAKTLQTVIHPPRQVEGVTQRSEASEVNGELLQGIPIQNRLELLNFKGNIQQPRQG